jgi:hypothetical protein
VLVSITHLNRIRAAHGMVRLPAQMGKKIKTQAQHLNRAGKMGQVDCS